MFPNGTLLFLKMQAAYWSRVSDFGGELAVPSGPLQAGRHPLTREVVLASQRGRLLDAMAHTVAERGYGATTVANVVARAGVSRKTFYEHFKDKEGCFLALYDTGIAYVLGRIAETLDAEAAESGAQGAKPNPESSHSDAHARIAAGLEAFLSVLADEPAFSRAIILEVHAAGSTALARRRATLEAFAQRYLSINEQARQKNPASPELSHEIALALVGAILELVSIRIEDGALGELTELTQPLTEFVERQVAPAAA